uniref:Uncharacterized protein n=1 Tax=Rhizophora mucronata TaxID=61149 RepID=A0A2P2J1M6_RHIMU
MLHQRGRWWGLL